MVQLVLNCVSRKRYGFTGCYPMFRKHFSFIIKSLRKYFRNLRFLIFVTSSPSLRLISFTFKHKLPTIK